MLIHEFRDWVEKFNPVMMQIRPAPGANDQNYEQLVRLLGEKGHVGRRCSR